MYEVLSLFTFLIYSSQHVKPHQNQKLLDSEEFQFRFDAGVMMPSISIVIKQKDEIVRSLMMHYLVFRAMSNGAMLCLVSTLVSQVALLIPTITQ